jgi:hypothetical protein
MFDEPTHPTWRESEVSPKLYSTSHSIYRCTCDCSMIYDPKWNSRIELYLMPGRLNTLDNNGDIPLFTKCLSRCVVYLTWSCWPFWHASFKVSIPPHIIFGWQCEQFPNVLNRGSYKCCRADANNHDIHLKYTNTACLHVTDAGGDKPYPLLNVPGNRRDGVYPHPRTTRNPSIASLHGIAMFFDYN